MKLNFFTSENFETEINPQTMLIGQPVHFTIDWVESFTPKFPVVFYVSSCIVQQPEGGPPFYRKSYDIIKNSCNSNLIGMKRHTEMLSSKTAQDCVWKMVLDFFQPEFSSQLISNTMFSLLTNHFHLPGRQGYTTFHFIARLIFV